MPHSPPAPASTSASQADSHSSSSLPAAPRSSRRSGTSPDTAFHTVYKARAVPHRPRHHLQVCIRCAIYSCRVRKYSVCSISRVRHFLQNPARFRCIRRRTDLIFSFFYIHNASLSSRLSKSICFLFIPISKSYYTYVNLPTVLQILYISIIFDL